jgi:hypothetical protein
MATWKKVIVSGSSAELAALKVDNLTSGSVVIGGGSTSNLSTTPINGTGNIVATTNATNLVHSGSFSGSFQGGFTGSFSGSAVFPALTQGTGVTAFSYNGSTTATVAVSGASTLNTNRISKWTGAAFADSSLTDNGTTITGATSLQLTGASTALTGSFTGSHFGPLTGTASFATSASYAFQATSASFASTAVQVNNALSFVSGLSGSAASYNGNIAVTLGISGAASLTTNLIPKWTGTGFANTNITDTGTQVQIGSGASSGVSVAAGGITVTGNSTFNNNLTVTGDLTVNGTASFVNSTNLYVKDQFIVINSGSNAMADSGIVVQYATGSGGPTGSAFFLEAGSAGTYGRWAVQYGVAGTATSVAADEWMVTAKINQASNPAAAPTWGDTTNGSGNIWVTNAGDIFIYA